MRRLHEPLTERSNLCLINRGKAYPIVLPRILEFDLRCRREKSAWGSKDQVWFTGLEDPEGSCEFGKREFGDEGMGSEVEVNPEEHACHRYGKIVDLGLGEDFEVIGVEGVVCCVLGAGHSA